MASRRKGPLTAFRIADKRHPLFDGAGAALLGARWNSPGFRVIYGACSYAGEMLEKLAQSGRMGEISKTHQSIKLLIPESVEIEEVSNGDLPEWNFPDFIESRCYGDSWLHEKRTAVLVTQNTRTFP